MNKIACLFLVLCFANPAWAAPQNPEVSTNVQRAYKPRAGQAHPDFVLPSISDATNIRLSDYRGKKVLLLHFASW